MDTHEVAIRRDVNIRLDQIGAIVDRPAKGCQRVFRAMDEVAPVGHHVTAGHDRVDPEQEKAQIAGLNDVRRQRDNYQVETALRRLSEVAQGRENTMPVLLECVEAYASIGEICDVLRGVFGEQEQYAFF